MEDILVETDSDGTGRDIVRVIKRHITYGRIAIILLVLLLISTVCVIIVLSTTKAKDHDLKLCTADACNIVSGQMLAKMDQSVKPCDDFAKYACGGYLKKNFLPINHWKMDAFSDLTDDTYGFFYEQFKYKIDKSSPQYQQNLKIFFDSCLNVTKRKINLKKSVKSFVNNLGGFSFSEDSDTDKLSTLFGKLGTFGLNPLFTAQTISTESTKYFVIRSMLRVPQIKESRYFEGVPSDHSSKFRAGERDIEDEKRRILQKYYRIAEMETVLQDFGLPYTLMYLNEVEEMIAKLLMNELEYTESQKTFVKHKQYQSNWNDLYVKVTRYIDWSQYMKTLFSYGNDYNKLQSLVLLRPIVFKKMGELIMNKPRVMKNTAIILALLELHDHLKPKDLTSPKYSSESLNFRMCIEAMKIMPNAINGLFAAQYFDKSKIPVVKNMIKNVQQAFIDNLNNLMWLHQDSKEQASKKAKNMKTTTAFPSIVEQTAKINTMNSNFFPTKEDYFNNVLNAQRLSTIIELKWTFDVSNVKPIWPFDSFDVNAFYYPRKNELTISAGIIGYPFFMMNAPRYMLYGALGSVIGHEITHGFDSDSNFFGGGKSTTWTNRVRDKMTFEKKGKCFVNQVNKLYLYDIQTNKKYYVNGTLTLAENIADAGGLKAAEKAYEDWTKSQNEKEKLLPGFEKGMTQEKLFYISQAQMWCEKLLPSLQIFKSLLADVHTPSMPRIKAIVMNSQKFSKAFNCPSGTPMNPSNKCSLW